AIGQAAVVVNGRNRWVLQLRGDARFGDEAASRARVGGVLILQHLDGNFAAKHRIRRAKNDPDAAASDFATQCVAVSAGRRRADEWYSFTTAGRGVGIDDGNRDTAGGQSRIGGGGRDGLRHKGAL